MRELSLGKIDEGTVNEDAARVTDRWIAVADGAGGGGLFADLWSKYLVDNIPDTPITDYTMFDAWLDGIWEPFYNDCERQAQAVGEMFLSKFYDEGSFATLAVVWDDGHWINYGDSVAFCYDKASGRLQHSFGSLAQFNNPPYLVNCKDPTSEKGFLCGQFDTGSDSIVFAATDTLAHYILMMHRVAHREQYADELQEAINAKSKNSNFVNAALSLPHVDFYNDVLQKLHNCINSQSLLWFICSLRNKNLIGHDDYTIAFRN